MTIILYHSNNAKHKGNPSCSRGEVKISDEFKV